MKGKHLNTGLRGGLLTDRHYRAMRESVWLFAWLVQRQTTQRMGTGLVLRGRPITYGEIAEDTGWPVDRIREWMRKLRGGGYISVKYSVYSRMVIRILKAKKFAEKQLGFPCGNTVEKPVENRPGAPPSSRGKSHDILSKKPHLKERVKNERNKEGAKGVRESRPAVEIERESYESPEAKTARKKLREIAGRMEEGINGGEVAQ